MHLYRVTETTRPKPATFADSVALELLDSPTLKRLPTPVIRVAWLSPRLAAIKIDSISFTKPL
jgi:hypothetical protein